MAEFIRLLLLSVMLFLLQLQRASYMPLLKGRMFWWGIIFMAVFLSAGAAADADEEYPDPHWKSGFCYKCHEEGWAEKGKNPKFKYDGDINKLCNSCHDVVSAHAYIHATGMIPSDEKLGVMSEEF